GGVEPRLQGSIHRPTVHAVIVLFLSQLPRCFACCCSRRRSIACAICLCSSAIFVKPFFRKLFARSRCHSADSSRRFSESSSVDIGCPLEECGAGRVPSWNVKVPGDVLGVKPRVSAPMRTPPRAWVRAPAERGSEIPRGTLGLGGVGGRPRVLADYALQGGAANGCSALQRGRERRAGDGRCFGVPASIDDLDRSGELLVGLRQISRLRRRAF